LFVLISQAIQVDPHISDSFPELRYCATVFATFGEDFAQFVVPLSSLIKEKMRASLALSEALLVLRRPRSDISARPQCSITDFTFLKRISRGAFGSVFLSAKKATGDIFAIKAVPRRHLSQKNQVQHLLAERDILLHFRSSYVVKFYYSMVGANNLYLVTEFVPGGDLYSLLEHVGALPEHVAKFYGFEIICALQYLRENGVIHRDIKPDNILVTADGHLKLTDFGLSHRGMVDRTVAPGEFVGTPDYVAPEIILNQPHSFSVDYWSLGAMLYEFVVGVPPFHAECEHETCRRALIGLVRWPADAECSPEFRDLIGRLLTLNPGQRLGNARIGDILAHPWFVAEAVSAVPPFVPELSGNGDTGYFEQRYEFDGDEDASILIDLEEGAAESGEIGSFSSIDFMELGEANRTVAEGLAREASPDYDNDNGGAAAVELSPQRREIVEGRRRRSANGRKRRAENMEGASVAVIGSIFKL
jgi:serine/threonine protein kinase